MKNFSQIHTSSNDLNRVQDNISIFTTPISQILLLDGVLIKDVDLTTSETKVNHTLNRLPNGWLIVKKDAAQDVYESGSTVPERFLSLTASGNVTVSLWVF
jgi:hypothetical protein